MNPKDTRTPEQDTALTNLLSALLEMYPIATLHGHNEFANKACPSFNVQEEYSFLINK
jgi:N-acetylmuramoyl-L-alanine amidase